MDSARATPSGRRRFLVGATATGLALAGGARAALGNTKVGTVQIEQTQVAFIGSANLGGGTLSFQGKSYRFTIGGLGIGGFGVSRMQASGDVYDLKELSQFPGAYAQARYGAVAVDKSTGELWMQNASGVLISLRARRTGLALSLGADGVYISLK